MLGSERFRHILVAGAEGYSLVEDELHQCRELTAPGRFNSKKGI